MANKLEVHFLGDSNVVIEHEIGRLGPRDNADHGFIEAKEQSGTTVYINRDQITFVRDFGDAEEQPLTGSSSYMGRR